MTPERAKEIRLAGSQYHNYEKHCTKQEDAYIRAVWDKMESDSCWYNALTAIERRKKTI